MTIEPETEKPANGICRICHQRVTLYRVSGTLRRHNNRHTRQVCEGSARRPVG